MKPLSGRRIALAVGGGIAAYKAAELCRELMRAGANVRVTMTHASEKFVTALTFQSLSGNPVLCDLLDPAQDSSYGHLALARWADLFIVAPATGDLIARLRAGMANDAVTTTLLAFKGPVLLAPAMNVAMWENARTQENVTALLAEPRIQIVGPNVGLLADGDFGAGRLSEIPEIVAAARAIALAGPLSGKKVLITAGPTREHLDPIRFLSNPSTGKMGLALADIARARGAQVTLVLGPVDHVERDRFEIVDVVSAEEMAKEVLSRVSDADYFIAAAAVSDYRPESVAAQKIKKQAGDETLTLVRTPDVLAQASKQVHSAKRRPLLIGFAAETEKVIANANEKLVKKNLDLIVANDTTQPGAGFGTDTNKVTVLSTGGSPQEFAGTKHEVAARIWDVATTLASN